VNYLHTNPESLAQISATCAEIYFFFGIVIYWHTLYTQKCLLF